MDDDYHPVVFRLRQLPNSIKNGHQAALLLSRALPDTRPETIWVPSLATIFTSPLQGGSTKTATVMFRNIPSICSDIGKQDTWYLDVGETHLILDCHFIGFTPLNDVEAQYEHKFNCIAISGLASHPFGSWQPRGQKRHMWIRDALPGRLTNTRAWVYGYNSKLLKDQSFQRIPDIASSLIEHLLANDFGLHDSPSLVFLAHSLGGLVLKQAMVFMANGSRWPSHALGLVRGIVFFGVPNFGMVHGQLATAVKGQPNMDLVNGLAVDAPYLLELDRAFLGTSLLRDITIFWGYETKTSPTLMCNDNGQWQRTGSHCVLVSPESATGKRSAGDACAGTARGFLPSNSFAINEDHSSMVKFPEGSEWTNLVIRKLETIVEPNVINYQQRFLSKQLPSSNNIDLDPSDRGVSGTVNPPDPQEILSTLKPDELDSRFQQIDDRAIETFDWVFSHKDIELKEWLRAKEGLFWIQGKPGSGKSTMMKFIFQHRRTQELLSSWEDQEALVKIGFFFHSRGTSLQKSLEGLQRVIIYHILDQHRQLIDLCLPHIVNAMQRDLSQRPPIKLKQEHWKNILGISLSDILRQRKRQLHICLFVDALDEFDGSPEVVKGFLMDLACKNYSDYTKVQLCFSSRPWGLFVESFTHLPGFAMNNYTKNDISQYCSQRLLQEPHIQEARNLPITEIVNGIGQRAQGVFLWAKLAVDFIVREARFSPEHINIRECLERMPGELDEFYSETLRRIPSEQRFYTFVFLELVVRGEKNMNVDELTEALRYSTATNYEDAMFMSKVEPTPLVHEVIGNACGGLLERVSLSSEQPGSETGFQPIHQTARDFVLGTAAKDILLGPNSFTHHDNGHVYKAKWLIATHANLENYTLGAFPPTSQLFYALLSAEKTTGKSMIDFFDTPPSASATIGLRCAAVIGLQLFFRDYIKRYGNISRTSQLAELVLECMIPTLVGPFVEEELYTLKDFVQRQVWIINHLRDNGHRFTQVAGRFLQGLTSTGHPLYVFLAVKVKFIWPMLAAIIDNETEMSFTFRSTALRPSLFWVIAVKLFHRDAFNWFLPLEFRDTTMLHSEIINPELVVILLRNECDPNGLDSRGYTPLDTAMVELVYDMAKESIFMGGKPLRNITAALTILYKAGGRPRRIPRTLWRLVLHIFDKDFGAKEGATNESAPQADEDTVDMMKGLRKLYNERYRGKLRSLNKTYKQTMGVR